MNLTARTASIASFILASMFVSPGAGQSGTASYELYILPAGTPFANGTARGIDTGGWDPLTVAGTMETASDCKATCWIRVSQTWTAHELPGLVPGADSWANAVAHVPWTGGELVLVAGAAADTSGAGIPLSWGAVIDETWNPNTLLTLNGGDGEARGLFLPDGTPVRTLYCGWAGETPPMTPGDASATATMKLRVPVIWEVTTTGERIIRPDFGVGLEAHVNNIGSSGIDGFHAVGGGQDGTGAWLPQLWRSTDDGENWSNEALPLPIGVVGGEATGSDYDTRVLVVAGYGESSGGSTVPMVWERDLSDPLGTWITNELPLPQGQEGGQNGHIHKRPGRTTYAATLEPSGEMALWTDDASGGGWTVHLPADYLTDPQVGVPMSAAGFDAFGRLAATVVASPPAPSASALGDTMAAVLVPSPATAVNPRPTPSGRIIISAVPNPFNPFVQITYRLPRKAWAVITIHDVTGRLVARFDEGITPAGERRTLTWDGTTYAGGRAPSGVYFIRVATSHANATRKVVLAK